MVKNMQGFMYIAEQTTPDDYPIKNLEVTNKHGVFFVSFDSCLHSFDVINRNNRQYLKDNIKENLQTERIQSMLSDNAWYGEMDHPLQTYQNQPLTPERINTILMERRSHKIMNPSFDGNLLCAHIETASGTEAGKGFASEIIQGLNPAFSCRAIAGLQLIDGKPTVIVRKVITYDWVLYPSHKEAHAISKPEGVVKAIGTVTESVKETVKEKVKIVSQDILIPLKEILENVGHRDPNTQLIMESFDLSQEDMVGFTPDHTHMMIKDGTNTIYSKISKESVDEVNDFFSSFQL